MKKVKHFFKKIRYSNFPIQAKVVDDFLPKPKNLELKQKKNKSTKIFLKAS